MIEWINCLDFEFPNNKQLFDNYNNTYDNFFLGVVVRKNRKGNDIEVVEPIRFCSKTLGGNYWEDVYGDEVFPKNWSLMPSKPEDL